MAEYEHFPNAPIVEALLDISIAGDSPVKSKVLGQFQDRIASEYPHKEIRNTFTARIELRVGSAPVAKEEPLTTGFLYRSADGLQVVQARNNGFSFSRLRPYQDWLSLSDEARSLWDSYANLVKPKRVTRIALRYVNRIELPLPLTDFKEYLLTAPEIAPALPQGLASFLFRVVIPDRTTGAVAIVTETIDEQSITDTALPLILDIDVFKQGQYPVNSVELWPLFDSLHTLKNQVFHGSLTEKAKEMFR